MIQETTIIAYKMIKEKGLLGNLQFKVYDCLFQNGAMTANELRHKIDSKSNSGVYCTRLSELERLGIVKKGQIRPCKITKNVAIEWEIEAGLPIKNKKTIKNKIQEIDIRIEKLFKKRAVLVEKHNGKVFNKQLKLF